MVGGEKHTTLFSLSEIKRVVEVLSIVNNNPDVEIDFVAIDSREVKKNSLFVPLPGLKTDGHNFLIEAVENGASVVFIASKWLNKIAGSLSSVLARYGSVGVVVNDPLKAMQALAHFYLERWKKAYKIGITGSNGKTTTKEMIASILSVSNKVAYNEKNFNSVIGLPLSIFAIKEPPNYIVFEMATNHPGEMAVLADLFQPDSALVTNIGRAHIGNFGSRDAIAREKKDIFKNFDGDNLAFIFEEDEYFGFLSERVNARIVSFGEKSTPGYVGCEDLGLDGYVIYWEGLQIRIPFIGKHNVLNALAAISIAVELGVNRDDVKVGLERMKPLFGRSEVLRGNYTFLVDCYNANPDSMNHALQAFQNIKWDGKKIAVLGDMFELGNFSGEEHYRVAVNAINSKVDAVIFFGEEFLLTKERFETGKRELNPEKVKKILWVRDFNELVRNIRDIAFEGDLILLKGSRGVELERVIPAIEKNVA